MSDQTSTTGANRANAAGFSAAIDLDHVSPAATFTATWTFTNTGTATWHSNYRIAYTVTPHNETAGFPVSPLGTAAVHTFNDLGVANVAPGASVNLTLTFTAPTLPGTYATNWQLQTPDGQPFGPIRWMRAVVTKTAVPTPPPPVTHAYKVIEFTNSVPNFNNMQPGRQFTGNWVLQNVGDAPWFGDFQIAYVDAATSDTEALARSQMGAPAISTLRDLTGKKQIAPNETVTLPINLIAPTKAGGYAFHWELRDGNGRSFGGIRWLQIGVVGTIDTPDDGPPPDADSTTQFGMNVNINPGGHNLDVDRMDGLGWVRFVFWASRDNKSPEAAYQQRYRHIIQSYASKGIRSLIVLHQDTYWGNGPWENGGWDAYAQNFGRECGRVAAACAEFGDMVAYQIYNEQDSGFGNDAGNPNHSAIGMTPQQYAPILDNAASAIRAAHPAAKIIFGGLKTGPDNAINYIKAVRKQLNGRLPVDALAYHPYGRFVNLALFNFGTIGRLSDALNLFQQAFPQMPLWISEVGVASDAPIGAEHYAKIATYIREVADEVADNFAQQVPVLIWFGWTDLMRNAGVNTLDGQPKPHVFDAFLHMKSRGKSTAMAGPDADIFGGGKPDATFVSYTSTVTNPDAVPAGSQFTSRWVFQNSGRTTWKSGYKLVYSAKGTNPASMSAKTTFDWTEVADKDVVRPQQTATVSLTLTAPETPGRTYRSQWQIQDPQGNAFGFLYDEVTVVPAPTAGTGARAANMAFLKDQTVPDHTQFVAGTDFDKQWLVQNTGSRHWGDGFRLVYVEGDLQLARGVASHLVPPAKPNETVTISVPMTAPSAANGQPTTYKAMFRMQDDRGNWFGDPVWVVMVSTTAVSPITGGDTALARLLNDSSMWYSQVNPTWASDKLGTGQATIGSWGCLMTCMAMGLSAYGTRLNPREMNQRMIALGEKAIVGSNVQFVAPWYIGSLRFNKNVKSWPDSDIPWADWTGEDPIQRIDNALAEGKIVIAQVDTRPNNGFYNNNNEQHWVVLVKRTPDGSDYLMIDPLTPQQQVLSQPRSLMAKYGSPVPSQSHNVNLRNAIKSTLVYHKSGGSGS